MDMELRLLEYFLTVVREENISRAAEILPELIAHFRERYPLVSFEIITGTADRVQEMLEHGLLDFGFLLESIDIDVAPNLSEKIFSCVSPEKQMKTMFRKRCFSRVSSCTS